MARHAHGEITALTGLRALAALAVFLGHFGGTLGDLFPGASFEILRRGYLGVDVFFVLSGFILSYNYADRLRSPSDYARFIGYRLARIYPLHLATLVAVVAGVHGAMSRDLTIHSPEKYVLDHHVLLHLTLTHAWGFEGGLRYNLPSWSISAEFFAYLLFPLFWAVSARGGRASLVWALVTTGATVLALRALGHPSLHVPEEHALVRVSGEFLAGCLAYRAYSLRPSATSPRASGEGLLLVGIAALALSPWADPGMAFGAVGLVYLLAVGSGPGVRLFCLPIVVWLGRISYAIYMTHLPSLSVLHRVMSAERLATEGWILRVGVVVLAVAFVLAVATVAYYAIERPARSWLRRAVRHGSGVTGGPSARVS